MKSPVTNRKRPGRRLPGPGQLRGLEWVHDRAYAEFEAVKDEESEGGKDRTGRSTGVFAGTSRREVEAALDWLRRFIARTEEEGRRA